ncbi:hypothetical protein [Streptomyces sp. NBC_01500]|uniref:hypothetical protein n=1 Tax=Streptomyces sp. NBC_01500 TaxID=2903886 RepID=UPI0022562C1B|nr:hypothetical protein [Streptomyces sp. NBC_01500]MCX4554147.1 hypothetical protein [Streptomyces sp. NBC_01500]
MTPISQERKYFFADVAEKYGKAYASVASNAFALSYSSKSLSKARQKTASQRAQVMEWAAVLILQADEYNGIESEKQAEGLVKLHKALYLEAADKDEKDRESWV